MIYQVVKNSLYQWKHWTNMHANAAGCSIKDKELFNFHQYANKELEDMDFNENIYDVNFIVKAKDDLLNLIVELGNIKDTYGQMNTEPLIAVEDLKVNKKEIAIMGSNKDTVKIIYNNVAYMFFKAGDFIENLQTLPDTFYLNVLGRANLNEYMGNITPQIMVDNWEVVQCSIFDF